MYPCGRHKSGDRGECPILALLTWPYIMVATIPEVILIISLTTILAGSRYQFRQVIYISAIHVFVLFLLRLYFQFGVHTVVSLFFVPYLFTVFLNTKYKTSLKWYALVISYLLVLELVVHILFSGAIYFGSSITWMLILYSLIVNLLLFLTLIILCKTTLLVWFERTIKKPFKGGTY